MKKALLVIGVFLVALSVMAPGPPDKAEKLRYDQNEWDREGGQFVISMSSQFGAATAGERADFKVGAKMTVKAGEKNYDLAAERGIQKVDGAVKDADNFIAIEPLTIKWAEGMTYEGVASVTTSAFLEGPSGKVQGVAVVTTTTAIIGPPSVEYDDNHWDYDPEKNAIVVPLLAYSYIVDFLKAEGYKVTVDVDVWNLDGSVAGSGKGSTDIVKVDDKDWDYVQIQPVFAMLDDGVKWNGDDDGSGIVSGSLELVRPDGSIESTTIFEKQKVGFVKPCEICETGP